jgi:hypothetical protein
MKAFNEIRRRIGRRGLASSFSLTEKSIPHKRDRDEHDQTGILTPDFNLAPAFPVQTSGCGSS